MNSQRSRIALLTSLLLVAFSLVALSQEKASPEAYSRVAIGTGGSVGGKNMSFNFRITQRTTDEQLQSLAHLFWLSSSEARRDRNGTGQVMAAAQDPL